MYWPDSLKANTYFLSLHSLYPQPRLLSYQYLSMQGEQTKEKIKYIAIQFNHKVAVF